MNSEQNNRLRVHYYFGDDELTSANEVPARRILSAIGRLDNHLRLFRTKGIWKEGALSQTTDWIYRLQSSDGDMEMDFFVKVDVAMVLIILVNPAVQGNGWKLKRFIKDACRVLFDCGFNCVKGAASWNSEPMKKRPRGDFRIQRDKSGLNKLVKLYLLMGFERQSPNSVVLEMTRDAFDKVGKRK